MLLALRVLVRWLHRNRPHEHDHPLRTPRQAFGIGLLHGLAGTGAVVLLLIAALPSPLARVRRARGLRADVGRLDGALHLGLRLDAHATGRAAGLPDRC